MNPLNSAPNPVLRSLEVMCEHVETLLPDIVNARSQGRKGLLFAQLKPAITSFANDMASILAQLDTRILFDQEEEIKELKERVKILTAENEEIKARMMQLSSPHKFPDPNISLPDIEVQERDNKTRRVLDLEEK